METLNPSRSMSENQLNIMTPGNLRVIRRNGSVTPYDDNKIAVAVTKAFLAVEGDRAGISQRIHETVAHITQDITNTLHRRAPFGDNVHIETIQDLVELKLMRAGEHKVARAYVLYREERRKVREQEKTTQPETCRLHITLANGQKTLLDSTWLTQIIQEACHNLTEVNPELILTETCRNLFDGVTITDVEKALIMSARAQIEKEPNYTYVSARLLLNQLHTEAWQFLGLIDEKTLTIENKLYPKYFKAYIERGIQLELLDNQLASFDLDRLCQALKLERDQQFTYLGLQTLYDRYFIHSEGIHFETPQAFFMRVAMGLALNEKHDREKYAISFYELLSSFDFMSSTPTLFNSGTLRPQLSSCFLTTIYDGLSEIYDAMRRQCVVI